MLTSEQKDGIKAGIVSRESQITQLTIEKEGLENILKADEEGLQVAREEIDRQVSEQVSTKIEAAKAALN